MRPYDKKIDFHVHFLSKSYVEYLQSHAGERPDNYDTPLWSEEEHLNTMQELGIAFSFISLSSPNISLADRATEKAIVRQINLDGAAMAERHPDKLGYLASLPLPHVEDALDEVRYVMDELHADGFTLTTNYAGIYLGHESFRPLMAELNRRRAIVCIHPTEPQVVPVQINQVLPLPTMEYFFDTTRTFVNLILSNTFVDFPEIKWIIPHAGAFISALSDRYNGFAIPLAVGHPEIKDTDIFRAMNHVYFDLSGFSARKLLPELLMDVDPSHLLYGSDYPYTPAIACHTMTRMLEKMESVNDEQMYAIMMGNAIRLVPRLKKIFGEDAVSAEGFSRLRAQTSLKERFRHAFSSAIYKKMTATR